MPAVVLLCTGGEDGNLDESFTWTVIFINVYMDGVVGEVLRCLGESLNCMLWVNGYRFETNQL